MASSRKRIHEDTQPSSSKRKRTTNSSPQVVRFRSLEKPKEDEFSLELSKHNNYDEVVESLARHLGLQDPSKIRLTPHNCYSQQPKPQPIKYRGAERLTDMLIHYNQISDILYYEVLDIPLPELQGLKTLKVAFHQATTDEVVIHAIRLPKQSTVADVISDLKTKIDLSRPDAELRLLEVFYHKIYKIFPLQEKIENINDLYWTLRAEEIPEEEKILGPNDRLIHVYHFMKDTSQNQAQVQNFGDPFFLVIHEGESLSDVKMRIQKKLEIADEEFAKWKFAFISLGRPEYLQDSDILSSRFQKRDVYGAWEQYLGLEHSDHAPKRSYAANQSQEWAAWSSTGLSCLILPPEGKQFFNGFISYDKFDKSFLPVSFVPFSSSIYHITNNISESQGLQIPCFGVLTNMHFPHIYLYITSEIKSHLKDLFKNSNYHKNGFLHRSIRKICLSVVNAFRILVAKGFFVDTCPEKIWLLKDGNVGFSFVRKWTTEDSLPGMIDGLKKLFSLVAPPAGTNAFYLSEAEYNHFMASACSDFVGDKLVYHPWLSSARVKFYLPPKVQEGMYFHKFVLKDSSYSSKDYDLAVQHYFIHDPSWDWRDQIKKFRGQYPVVYELYQKHIRQGSTYSEKPADELRFLRNLARHIKEHSHLLKGLHSYEQIITMLTRIFGKFYLIKIYVAVGINLLG